MIKNRWSVLIGSIIIQLSVGTIYTWSLFNQSLMYYLNEKENVVVLTFSISIFVFAFSTILSGKLLDRFGPRFVATIGGLLYGFGYIFTSMMTSITHLYVFYGVFAGMGVGFIYVCPLSTLVKWFPNSKGKITGIAVGAFGLGSFIFEMIIVYLLDNYTITETFLYLGILYLLLILIGSQLLTLPDNKLEDDTILNESNLTSKEMFKNKKFYLIFITYLFGCTSGLLIIGLAKDIGLDNDINSKTASSIVALIALFNASGRILWGTLSDKLGRYKVVFTIFIITFFAMMTLSIISLNVYTFFILLSTIGFCFGGFLALYPLITAEQFGHKYFGSNYGIMYQAYGLAALLGPLIVSQTNSLTNTFLISSILALIGAFIIFYLNLKKEKELI